MGLWRGGFADAERCLDEFEGVALGAGLEPGDDLFLVIGLEGFEGGVGAWFMFHSFAERLGIRD